MGFQAAMFFWSPTGVLTCSSLYRAERDFSECAAKKFRSEEMTKMSERRRVSQEQQMWQPASRACDTRHFLSFLTEWEWWLLWFGTGADILHSLCLSTQTPTSPNTPVFVSKDWTAKVPETKVPQSHLSCAECDVITNCSRRAHLPLGAAGRGEGGNAFCPSAWEIHGRVFTWHSVLLRPPPAAEWVLSLR